MTYYLEYTRGDGGGGGGGGGLSSAAAQLLILGHGYISGRRRRLDAEVWPPAPRPRGVSHGDAENVKTSLAVGPPQK